MLAERLTRHPGMTRRTAQCLIAKMIGNGQVTARGVKAEHAAISALVPTPARCRRRKPVEMWRQIMAALPTCLD